MRLLVLTNMYPPHHYGGYELNCEEFVEALRARGDEVLVLTSEHRVAGVDDGDEPGVRRLLRLYWRDGEVVRPSLRASRRIERWNQRVLAAALDDLRPDVVSAWHMGAMSLGLLSTCHRRGLRVVHVVNDDWLVYAPLVDRWARLARRPRRRLGRDGTFVLISEAVRAGAEQAGVRFADAVVGRCGVNTAHFPVGAHPARAAWSWRLLHVGRVDPRKGIDTAIEALALLPVEATLDVVGTGDDAHRADLAALAGRLGLGGRVRFGVEPRDRLADRYAAADALVFPTRWAEPFGLVPLEAMACSTPVVATGTGGSGEYLADGRNCLLVPPDDPAALAAALRRLADDPGLRGHLVDGGLATASELTLDRWLELLVAVHDGPRPTPTASPPPAGRPARARRR